MILSNKTLSPHGIITISQLLSIRAINSTVHYIITTICILHSVILVTDEAITIDLIIIIVHNYTHC